MPDANNMNRVIGQLHGRTQVLRWQIDMSIQPIQQVNRKDRAQDSRINFNIRARQLNVANNALDTADTFLLTGNATVPVMSRNTDCRVSVESDSWLPVVISGASWEGNYSDRSKEVG